jgi:class 3 adenylate cyclase
MQGERRIVTMLFCDVVGSTSMAETLDPEESTRKWIPWTVVSQRPAASP